MTEYEIITRLINHIDPLKPLPAKRLHQGPHTGADLSDGFTHPEDEDRAVQDEADFLSAP